MRTSTVARRLAKRFPHIRGIQPAGDWGGEDYASAVHLGDAGEGGQIDELPAATYYDDFGLHEIGYEFGVHPKLVAALKGHGYYAEWHDAGTLIAWPV